MRNSDETPTTMTALRPHLTGTSQNDRETRSLRILLVVALLAGAISALVPKVSSQSLVKINLLPQLLIAFVVLALIFTLHLAYQRGGQDKPWRGARLPVVGVDPASRRAGIKQLLSAPPDLEALLNLAEQQVIEQDRFPVLNAQFDEHIKSAEQSPPSWLEINRNDERRPDPLRLFVRWFPRHLSARRTTPERIFASKSPRVSPLNCR